MFQQGENHTPRTAFNRVEPSLTYKHLIHKAWTRVIKPDEACGMWEFDQEIPRFECLCYSCMKGTKNHAEKATAKMLFWLAEKIADMKKNQRRTEIVETEGSGLQFSILQYEEAFDLVLKRFNEMI
jgi:hypothetical protein